MFYSLTGRLTHVDSQIAVIDCGGVGFKCLCSLNTIRSLSPVGSTVSLYTYLSVREDALDLFGFYTENELNYFKLLTSVSGVGPKVALAMLSDFTSDQLALAIASGDSKMLTKASGVGPKLAQRLVLELRDKITDMNISVVSQDISAISAAAANSSVGEAAAALIALGYTQTDAMSVLAKLDQSLPVEKLISQALKVGGKNV